MFLNDHGEAFRRDADSSFFEDESVPRVTSEEEVRISQGGASAAQPAVGRKADKPSPKSVAAKPKKVTKAQARRFVDKMTASGW